MVFLRLLTLVGTRAIFTALIASSKFSSSSGIPSLLTKIPASHQDSNKIKKWQKKLSATASFNKIIVHWQMNSCAISWIQKSNCVAWITCFAQQTFSCDLCKINKFLMSIIWAIQHDVFISTLLGTKIQQLLTFFDERSLNNW